MGRNKHRHPTHRRNRCIARKYKGFRRALCHAADEVSACVVTVVTVVTVNCMVRAAKGAAIGFACGWEHPRHPARRMNRCIARKYKGFRRALCHAADEVPACVVTVVTVVTVNCMVRIAKGAALVSACGQEHPKHPARRMNRCIARKYKGFRCTLCHAADEVPACMVTVVTVVTVNRMVRAANGAAIGSACRREHSMHPGIP
ncbi:MAG: hypothetical protein ACOX63_14870 [Christensenellales bacterium]